MKKRKLPISRRTFRILIGVIVLCLVIGFAAMYFGRTQQRQATAEEMAASMPYRVHWQEALGSEESDLDIILSLCIQGEDVTIGSNTYKTYISDSLPRYLHNCATLTEILQGADGSLNISYTDSQERLIILGYNAEGLVELGIYDPKTDVMFHDIGGSVTVWENFRSGQSFL